jgi:hypothetical protein
VWRHSLRLLCMSASPSYPAAVGLGNLHHGLRRYTRGDAVRFLALAMQSSLVITKCRRWGCEWQQFSRAFLEAGRSSYSRVWFLGSAFGSTPLLSSDPDSQLRAVPSVSFRWLVRQWLSSSTAALVLFLVRAGSAASVDPARALRQWRLPSLGMPTREHVACFRFRPARSVSECPPRDFQGVTRSSDVCAMFPSCRTTVRSNA